jgi:hypothetical protein
MMTRFLRLLAMLAAPIAMAAGVQAQTETYDYDPATDDGPPTLILYSGANYSGEAREIYDPVYALPNLQFNDRARSIAVLSGQWEVCQHSDFTGRCVFLRYDVPDLAWYGMDAEISSVRPVYEYTDAEHGLMFVRDENGYIRYVDDEQYGYDTYSYGYGASTSIQVYHYGYSPDYRRYGYYDPRLGYDPYGFGWYGYSQPYYSSTHYRRERPPLRGHYGARDAAVTLYTDSYDRGASLGINRGIRDLSRYRFNDNVSSIQIRSGKWEVCEHANFQGRCQIVDASVDKLNGLRLNDNISSIRPVGSTGHDRWDRHERGGRDGRRGDWTGGDRRDGDRRDGDRTRRDAPQAGISAGTYDSAARTPPKAGRLPPGIRNMQSEAAAAQSAAPVPRAVTSPPVRRPGERAEERRIERSLSGGPAGRSGTGVRATPAPNRARIEPPSTSAQERRGTPRSLTPKAPEVRAAPTRDTRPPGMRRIEPQSRPATPVRRAPEVRQPAVRAPATPAPRMTRPASPPPQARAPASQPVSRPAPSSPPRASAPRPAPQAAPKRDTRPPAMRSSGRPTRTQD